MRVFVTGSTGFIGSRLVPELLQAGHRVLGLTRSDAGADALAAAGAEAHRGDLTDLSSLREGADKADAVVHCAFDHVFTDFNSFIANCEKDRKAIGALAEGLGASGRPMVITSGVGLGTPPDGGPAVEQVFDTHHPNPRIATELAGQAALQAGVNVSVMRLPQVHDTVKQGLITPLVAIAREKGVSPYVGEGANRWSAGHVDDVARLYRLAVEAGKPGARYNAVGEEGVSLRRIAETVGRGLGVPSRSVSREEAAAHFGWMAAFASMDMAASSAWTRQHFGWTPSGPDLIADLEAMTYQAS